MKISKDNLLPHIYLQRRSGEGQGRELWILLNYSQFQKYTMCFLHESLVLLFPLPVALVRMSGQKYIFLFDQPQIHKSHLPNVAFLTPNAQITLEVQKPNQFILSPYNY